MLEEPDTVTRNNVMVPRVSRGELSQSLIALQTAF